MRFIIAIGIVIASVAAAILGRDYVPVGEDASSTTKWAAQATLIVLLPIVAFVAAVYRYKKPRADQALVRTGGRDAKISISGGMWLNTIIHEVREIFLDTVRLDIIREGQDALITHDFLRADIEAAFFIRVEPEEARVLRAAQSLGERTMTAEEITELLESKLEGAL